MTYLQIVNKVLRRLRENEVSSINENPYSLLIGDLVNVVKREVEDAWDWDPEMILAGRRFYPIDAAVPIASYGVAVLVSTVSILSLGFLIASVVPTARFAQPIGGLVLYPMLGLSGLFVPLDALPPLLQGVARVLPLTYVVSLLRGIWRGEGWLNHGGDVAVLALMFLLCTVISAKVFRWE